MPGDRTKPKKGIAADPLDIKILELSDMGFKLVKIMC